MELRKAEALGVLNDHDSGVGRVHTDFDHGRGDKYVVPPRLEGPAYRLLLHGAHAPVQQTDAVAEDRRQLPVALFRAAEVGHFAVLDQRAHPIGLVARLHGAADGVDDVVHALQGQGDRFDRLPPGGLFVQDGDVEIAVAGERQRARNGRGGHDEQVGCRAFLGQRQAVAHAEAVLLVDDDEPEPVEFDTVLKQGVCADHQVDVAFREAGVDGNALLALVATRERFHHQAGRLQHLRQRVRVLSCEDFGRRHERDLRARLAGKGGRQGGHEGLARPHIALQQARHARARTHVGLDLLESARLRSGRREGRALQHVVDVFAGRVQRLTLERAVALAHQCHGQLLGKQLVIGEPPEGRGGRLDVHRVCGLVQTDDGLVEARPVVLFEEGGVEPFRQGVAQADGLQSTPYRLARDFGRKAGRQRVDRLIGRQLVRLGRVEHIVRPVHLRLRVVDVVLAADQALRADRVEPLQRGGEALEEDKIHLTRLVIDPDLVGCRLALSRHMATDGHQKRRHVALQSAGDARTVGAVDELVRRGQQQVLHTRGRSHGKGPLEAFRDLVADTAQTANIGEPRIEDRGAHASEMARQNVPCKRQSRDLSAASQ